MLLKIKRCVWCKDRPFGILIGFVKDYLLKIQGNISLVALQLPQPLTTSLFTQMVTNKKCY